jgi:hypothetical protein
MDKGKIYADCWNVHLQEWFLTTNVLANLSILKDENRNNQLFANLNLDSIKDEAWREKVIDPFLATYFSNSIHYYKFTSNSVLIIFRNSVLTVR